MAENRAVDRRKAHTRISYLLALLAYLADDARGQCLDPLPYREEFQHWLDGLIVIASDAQVDVRTSPSELGERSLASAGHEASPPKAICLRRRTSGGACGGAGQYSYALEIGPVRSELEPLGSGEDRGRTGRLRCLAGASRFGSLRNAVQGTPQAENEGQLARFKNLRAALDLLERLGRAEEAAAIMASVKSQRSFLSERSWNRLVNRSKSPAVKRQLERFGRRSRHDEARSAISAARQQHADGNTETAEAHAPTDGAAGRSGVRDLPLDCTRAHHGLINLVPEQALGRYAKYFRLTRSLMRDIAHDQFMSKGQWSRAHDYHEFDREHIARRLATVPSGEDSTPSSIILALSRRSASSRRRPKFSTAPTPGTP